MADDGQEIIRDVLAAKDEKQTAERVQELVGVAFDAVSQTRATQRLHRSFIRGEVHPSYPKGVSEAIARVGEQMVRYRSPQQTYGPLKFVSELAARWPELKRYQVGRGGRESAAVSNRIERLANGVMLDRYPYEMSCDLVGIDSEAASWVLPSTAHWALPTDQYDYLTPEQWGMLPDELRDLWEYDEAKGKHRRYARQYRRDARGLAEWDDEYSDEDEQGNKRPFREDTEASAAAVQEAIEERVRSKVPLDIDVLSYEQMAPLRPRFVGTQLTIDGMARQESFDANELYRRGYRWFKDGPGLIPAETMGGGAVTLRSVLIQDREGRPFLLFSVDGLRTELQTQAGEYCDKIDLYDRYGLDFLPVAYAYGLHFAAVGADSRVVPLLDPVMGSLLIRNKIVTLSDFHAGQTAWGGYWIKPDPAIVQAYPALAQKLTFEPKALQATVVPGDVRSAVHDGSGQEVVVLKAMVDMDLAENQPAPAQPAAGASGIAQAISNRDQKREMAKVWNGVDSLFATTAQHACRALACLARKRGENIKLNLLTEVPGEQRGLRSTTRSTVEVDPDMFGGDYTLVTQRPDKLGDNPAKTMLAIEMWSKDVGTIDAVAESIGESDTWGWMADVFSQRTLLATPEGRKMILEDAAKTNADLRELERAKLREQQVVDEQGIPMAASAGVEGLATPDQNGQPVVTADLSSGGMQSLGAQYGAAQATGPINNIAAAGGDASGLEMGAGGV